MDNILAVMDYETIDEKLIKLADRFRKIRKRKNISQMKLSKMSNVSYGSIKRFEQFGEISLNSLLKLCISLGIQDEIDNMFTKVRYSSIEEVLKDD